MAIECLVLGAGQEVGKSCVVVSIGGKKIMFDCGMHMGYLDSRRYPDFSLISETGDFDSSLTCVVITHFHLDHVGALPYFTEVCGYHGPIYMTYPTKALAPIMLEDYRKVMVERRGEEEQFSYDHIMECMRKVIPLDLKQTVQVDKDLQIRAYYAGHVLGAAMIYAKVGGSTMVYTGDYNMTPDRHLGAAQIDRLRLDLLITESTYATTIRDSKYAREREFLKAVHKCVAGGGKVLIPTFALGRAQELCILLDDYWERMNLNVPIYFSAGLTIQANMYYKMLIGWTSQKIKDNYTKHNPFDFKHVCSFERSLINAPGPCVLFATPGMISGGFSLEVFKHWAPSEKNLITLPGYCVAGTIGHKLMSGKPTRIDLDADTHIDVRCQIHQLSFSPHTDAKGIMDLIDFLFPQHVILVHGEKPKMASLTERIQSELGIPCYYPANNETVLIPTSQNVKVDATGQFMRSCHNVNLNSIQDKPCISNFSTNNCEVSGTKIDASKMVITSCCNANLHSTQDKHCISNASISNCEVSELAGDENLTEGILVMEKSKTAKVVSKDELLQMLGAEKHVVQFARCFPVRLSNREQFLPHAANHTTLQLLCKKLSSHVKCKYIESFSDHLQLDSLRIRICSNEDCPFRTNQNKYCSSSVIYFCCSWSMHDENLASKCLEIVNNLDSTIQDSNLAQEEAPNEHLQ
ncbi:cleavage and polyadenylation specificity factor subunit 3-II [Ananas comosus]|uniref:Cleavage and polyadenylation specificity factor subunit 3-II n=2 Tax=Ananas comosus TaxID=4615 RepID=A0A6P5EPF8_ANACO|nr:cleavage and polyadenylation specificity factor subunit 3-II [Ananas comosus]